MTPAQCIPWVLLLLLAACERRPELQRGSGPPAPTDAAFQQLPSVAEVEQLLTQRYDPSILRSVAVDWPQSVVVRWREIRRGAWGHPGQWTYRPQATVWLEAASTRFPDAVRRIEDPLRWHYSEGRWQVESLYMDYRESYAGIDDPSAEQVVALLQMPGIQYGLLGFAQVPQAIQLTDPPQFARDAEGYAAARLPVRFRAEVERIDFAHQQLHREAVELRAVVICEVREQRWSVLPEVEFLGSRRLSSRPASTDELHRLHWEMDRWWRHPRG